MRYRYDDPRIDKRPCTIRAPSFPARLRRLLRLLHQRPHSRVEPRPQPLRVLRRGFSPFQPPTAHSLTLNTRSPDAV